MTPMNQFSFIARTAWRDARRRLGRLFLYISTMIMGVTALVAINSFHDLVIRDIDRQADSLLGADFAISTRTKFDSSTIALVNALDGDMTSARELLSMVYIPKVNESVFVNVKALSGAFPYYGRLDTEPPESALHYQSEAMAIVDASLMELWSLEIGDSIEVGDLAIPIGGKLLVDIGGNFAAGFAPPIYIKGDLLDETGLIQPGSLVTDRIYKKSSVEAVTEWMSLYGDRMDRLGYDVATVSTRKSALNEAFDAVNGFMNVVALVALILGCLGLAGSIMVYIKSKISSVAIMRCLGMSAQQAFGVYFLQISIMGLCGTLIGCVIGALTQWYIPGLLGDLLPMKIEASWSWGSIVQGLVVGMVITLLFAMLPLLSLRKISPLRTLRVADDVEKTQRDAWTWIIYGCITCFIYVYLWWLTNSAMMGAYFILGLGIGYFLLYGTSWLVIYLMKRIRSRSLPFVYRQGIKNMHRPNNQTQILLVSLGLGTAVLTMLFIIKHLILFTVSAMDSGEQPNMIIYGIGTDQQTQIQSIIEEHKMPLLQQVPVVTMELIEWKGRTKEEWMADTLSGVKSWAANRESRVTYRSMPDKTDKVVRGDFVGHVEPGDSIWISLDEGYADALGIDIGDEMIFNVQGVRMTTYVSSLRHIEFRNMQARFFIVFPTGVLERAPQFHIMVSKSPDAITTGRIRSQIVRTLPNVSVVDLTSILKSIQGVLNKASHAIRFLAGFCLLTGFIVLISSLLLSKYQRLREVVLLRILGATTRQIWWITATEYLILGFVSSLMGIVIAIGASYIWAVFQFDLTYSLPWQNLISILLIMTLLIVIIGVWSNRSVVRKPPLVSMQNEI